ncbi:hypothetical protein RQM47_16740 [Rubrivirga sp. S365]|uniref:AZL_007920/MXAN_0976 family protein n=1 Tax=Rubrivirga litoralis TaxID=3075598 RepID=A0ABU3BV88_9BACT|nr:MULTISPECIES: hypothetical protein [unclassified Rubrivirga]MDT0633203.1 hypothetical protein [Rubrivirga sp. F394]MDT7858299.1 hypothetical protein [Rubrivirga sp. S365]
MNRLPLFASFKLLLVSAVVLALPSCSLTDREAPEPLSSFRLYPETPLRFDCGSSSPLCSWSASGALTDLSLQRKGGDQPGSGYDYLRLVFTADDTTHAFELHDLTPSDVRLVVGRLYDVALGVGPTSTGGYTSLLVTDDDGLAFYGSSVPALPDGGTLPLLDGWAFGVEPAEYGWRDAGCGLRDTPLRLTVEHEGRRVKLVQGESVRFSPHTVEARVVKEFDLSGYDCTDPNFIGLSVIIRRDAQ